METDDFAQKFRVDVKEETNATKKWEYFLGEEYGCVYGHLIYPGIFLWKNDFYMQRIPNQITDKYPYMKLNYCIQGRCEASLEKGRFVYLESGMISVDCNQPEDMFIIPNARYEGLEIILDMDVLKNREPPILSDFGIDLMGFYHTLQSSNGGYLASVSKEWREKAEVLSDKIGTTVLTTEECRFETTQLLYMLFHGHTTPLENVFYLTQGQKGIAMEVENILCLNLKQHYTVADLANKYNISASSLEKYFAGVYGTSINKYLRKKRIERAAELLQTTDIGIADIAAEVGYSNQSKFGSAFKFQMGTTPLEFRRLQR